MVGGGDFAAVLEVLDEPQPWPAPVQQALPVPQQREHSEPILVTGNRLAIDDARAGAQLGQRLNNEREISAVRANPAVDVAGMLWSH
jgi:hypothetical protein